MQTRAAAKGCSVSIKNRMDSSFSQGLLAKPMALLDQGEQLSPIHFSS